MELCIHYPSRTILAKMNNCYRVIHSLSVDPSIKEDFVCDYPKEEIIYPGDKVILTYNDEDYSTPITTYLTAILCGIDGWELQTIDRMFCIAEDLAEIHPFGKVRIEPHITQDGTALEILRQLTKLHITNSQLVEIRKQAAEYLDKYDREGK